MAYIIMNLKGLATVLDVGLSYFHSTEIIVISFIIFEVTVVIHN